MDITVSLIPKQIDIDDFEKLCKNHDWTYHFSDSHNVWIAGNRVDREIKIHLLNNGNDFKKVYLKYCYLPYSESEVIESYKSVRDKFDLMVGSDVRKYWESNTKLDESYIDLPRNKRGWWWLCELANLLEKNTGEQPSTLGTWCYTHLV